MCDVCSCLVKMLRARVWKDGCMMVRFEEISGWYKMMIRRGERYKESKKGSCDCRKCVEVMVFIVIYTRCDGWALSSFRFFLLRNIRL